MRPPETADCSEWTALGPRYAALRDEPLTLEGVDAWLGRWSDLRMAVREGRTRALAAAASCVARRFSNL